MLTIKQEEAVLESLKNILLVMSSSEYLVPPSKDPSQEKLWVETWKRIDRFLPDLRRDLDLEAPAPKDSVKEKEKREEIEIEDSNEKTLVERPKEEVVTSAE